MHVECARKADHFMQHSPGSKTFLMFCYDHKPLPTDSELIFQFWEKVDSANSFIEQYSDFIRKHGEHIK